MFVENFMSERIKLLHNLYIFVVTGVIGDWKNWFTVAQNDQFNDMYQKEMATVDGNFTFDNPVLSEK